MLRARVPRPAAWLGVVPLAVAMLVAAAPTAPVVAVAPASAAVESGSLEGTVRSGGFTLEGVDIEVSVPGAGWGTSTGMDGTYVIEDLPPDDYTVTASLRGYRPSTASVTIVAGERATVDFELSVAPRRTISGHVRDESGAPVSGGRVFLPDSALDLATTGADGTYRIPGVPEGQWYVRADFARCLWPATTRVTVAGDTTADFVLEAKRDSYGHTCAAEPSGPADWVNVGDPLALSGYGGSVAVPLPFPVNLYEQSYRSAYVSGDGYLSFTTSSADLWSPPYAPDPYPPNAAIYAMAGDLFIPEDGQVRAGTVGVAPHRAFVVTWDNVTFVNYTHIRVSFQVALEEAGRVVLRYRGLDDQVEAGGGGLATVGIEDETGWDGIPYTMDEPVLADDTAVVFEVPGTGFVNGVVTDANDRRPVPGAVVTVRQKGAPDRVVRTDADGWFQVRARPGTVRLRFTADNYVSATKKVTVPDAGVSVRRDAVLRTARVTASAGDLEFVVPPGQTRRGSITITNSGGAATDWSVREVGGGRQRTAPPADRRAAVGDPTARTSRSYATQRASAAAAPSSVPGRIIRSWPATGLRNAWGVGFQNGVWISDAYVDEPRNVHFDEDGTPGQAWPLWAEWTWGADMAFVPGAGRMCQLDVGGGIYCWNPATGAVSDSIAGDFPWTQQAQHGLAYRPDDDSFYVAGWVDGILYHVKGLSHPDPGAVIDQCWINGDSAVSGLGWNRTHHTLWVATNSHTDTIYQLNPDTCETLKVVAPPDNAPYTGAGLDVDPLGYLWLTSQGTVYQIDGGLPESNDVPWLRVRPTRGRLAPGDHTTLTVTVDASRLGPGVYGAYVVLVSDSGRQPEVVLPVRLEVRA